MAATCYCKGSRRASALWMLGLVLLFAGASHVGAQQAFTSGSDGSDGAYDLTGTTPGTVMKFDPTHFHGSGVANNVFNFTAITIPTGVTVKLSGDRINGPVYWLAQGNVDIEGTVDLSGQDGAPPAAILEARTRAIPGAGGFAGGVGGKFDAFPIPAGEPGAQPGDGPGGGSVNTQQLTCIDPSACCGLTNLNGGNGGQNTANPLLAPLIGGSGGAGGNLSTSPGNLSQASYGAGGGAGGGAILIASSATIMVNGIIAANGGLGQRQPGALGCPSASGGGAGGGIRLAAPTITGGGTLTATAYACGGACGGPGFVRLEAFTDDFHGTFAPPGFNGTPESMGSPFSTFIPTNGPPSLKIVSVNGVSVTQPPTGNLATPDATINATSPVAVSLQAANIPPGTVLTLHVFSDDDMDQTVHTTPLLGTLQSSTATATLTFPSGFSLASVKATWAP